MALAPGPDVAIGASACILGHGVRWNGGHKLDDYVAGTLGRFVRFVPVCPEAELGLGVPREPVRLIRLGRAGEVRMRGVDSGADHTDAMNALAEGRAEELAAAGLCGFVVQKGSPSCGMERVKVYGEAGGAPRRDGRGLFTAALMRRLPDLPVEEDGRLHDPALRESFIARVFAYHRMRALFGRPWKLGELVEHHAREKMLVLAHDRAAYQELGRLVAGARRRTPARVADDYRSILLGGLARVATRGKHTNVLQHLTGYFKDRLDDGDRAELREVIESYRVGVLPLVVPVSLLRHHVRRNGVEYLARQTYLDPYPLAIALPSQRA